jgi:hypothetical protein
MNLAIYRANVDFSQLFIFCGGICERTLEIFCHFAYAQVCKDLRIAGVLPALRKPTGVSDE